MLKVGDKIKNIHTGIVSVVTKKEIVGNITVYQTNKPWNGEFGFIRFNSKYLKHYVKLEENDTKI